LDHRRDAWGLRTDRRHRGGLPHRRKRGGSLPAPAHRRPGACGLGPGATGALPQAAPPAPALAQSLHPLSHGSELLVHGPDRGPWPRRWPACSARWSTSSSRVWAPAQTEAFPPFLDEPGLGVISSTCCPARRATLASFIETRRVAHLRLTFAGALGEPPRALVDRLSVATSFRAPPYRGAPRARRRWSRSRRNAAARPAPLTAPAAAPCPWSLIARCTPTTSPMRRQHPGEPFRYRSLSYRNSPAPRRGRIGLGDQSGRSFRVRCRHPPRTIRPEA
jgi:hypothetical protein